MIHGHHGSRVEDAVSRLKDDCSEGARCMGQAVTYGLTVEGLRWGRLKPDPDTVGDIIAWSRGTDEDVAGGEAAVEKWPREARADCVVVEEAAAEAIHRDIDLIMLSGVRRRFMRSMSSEV